MSWDQYTKTATKSSGLDFPEVPDDLYEAMIQDVTEPTTSADVFNAGKERTQFVIKWELTSGDVPDGTVLWQYVALPEQYLENGYLSEKANLYKIMEALGFAMDDEFDVNPPEWQGLAARVMVENRPNKDGDMRPRITAVKPKRAAKPPVAAKKQPVGAGLRGRLESED